MGERFAVIACGACALSILLFVSEGHAQRTSIKLTVGQSHAISTRETIRKVQVLDPAVADVANYSSRGATVVGVGAGTTELLIMTTRRSLKYTIVVTAVELGRLFKQVRTFLGRVEGIYPQLLGETILISGSALTADDYGRAQQAAKLFGNQVRNMVRFKPSAVDQVNHIIQDSGMTSVTARLVGGTLFIEGAVDSKNEQDKLTALLRAYGLTGENLVRVGSGKQILVDVQFIEMRKGATQNLGIRWPSHVTVKGRASVTGEIPISPPGGQKVGIQIQSPIDSGDAAINMLVENGYARLLAQPRLVCGSGKSAEFLVGGEVPIVEVTNNAVSINFKPFGIRLKVLPTADSLGMVQADIEAEVSEPDFAMAVRDVPGFRTRRFTTSVAVRGGSSIVLSNLFSNSEQKVVAKLPLLGHIPILGELFKSRAFQEQKTNLVVFVTPTIVSPQDKWVKGTIRDLRRLYDDYEAEVGWQLFD